MPIGTSKLGVLGAGVVPGGTQTFNASGTFSVPPGVSKVSITGKGGTGNPGNAGNPGNPGNQGTGGGGGASGGVNYPYGYLDTGYGGGLAYKVLSPPVMGGNFTTPSYTSGPFGYNLTSSNCFAFGGMPVGGPVPAVGSSGQAGASGTGGSAGNAGNPGTSGNASNGLCKTFPGGAGGNAGAAGAAGNGGSGGNGGAQGNPGPGNGGSGGNGGGNGGNGAAYNSCYNPVNSGLWGSVGGGGAGSVNSGQSGSPSTRTPLPCRPILPGNRYVRGGDGNVTAPLPNTPWVNATPGINPSTMGGGVNVSGGNTLAGNTAINIGGQGNNSLPPSCSNRTGAYNLSPANNTDRLDALRAGGGGGGNVALCTQTAQPRVYGGGGGGGGRGLAGNAGGNSTGGAGSAGTPQTFNCVSVTPGSSYPITVAAPGGQIVISWNPQ